MEKLQGKTKMKWENNYELEEVIKEEYKIETGLIDHKGNDAIIDPRVDIDQDEITLIYEVDFDGVSYTEIGSETLNQVQEIASSYLLSAEKVCFEITEQFNDKNVILTIDRNSFEDAIRAL